MPYLRGIQGSYLPPTAGRGQGRMVVQNKDSGSQCSKFKGCPPGTSCGTLGKLLNLSKPQFSDMQDKDDNNRAAR